jgi:hypothetical protein
LCHIKLLKPDAIKPQVYDLFLKRKFGLYKTSEFENKRVKYLIKYLINTAKFSNIVQYKQNSYHKKIKIIFSKKLNRLFFRAGRKILGTYLSFKKHIIQRYMSRKITHEIKKITPMIIYTSDVKELFIQCGVFYSIQDVKNFINLFGLRINNTYIFTHDYKLQTNDIISII